MTAKLPFMPLYVSDYLADTTHLTCEEHGAYLLLLIAMWKTGGTLPCDDIALARIARLPLPRWKKMRPNVIAFFLVEGAVLHHKRVTAEIEKSKVISETRSAAGKEGAEAKRLKKLQLAEANADDLLKQNASKREPSHTSHFTDITSSSGAIRSEPESGRAALCASLARKIAEHIGITDDHRSLENTRIVQGWLDKGFDPDQDIWAAVSARVDFMKKSGKGMPSGLKYFTNVIADRNRERASGASIPAPSAPPVSVITVKRGTAEFSAWLDHQRKLGKRTKFLETQDALTVPKVELETVMRPT